MTSWLASRLMASTTSTPRQTRNGRRKMQRKKAKPPLVKPAARKHPFWQLLSPSQYLALIGGWEWDLIGTARHGAMSPALAALCRQGMEEALANEQLGAQVAGQSTSSTTDWQPSVLLPDVAFIQAANNLVYETLYESVVVSANMMTDEMFMLMHQRSESTPLASAGGNGGLPPPPFLPPNGAGPTFQIAARTAERPNLTLSLTSPVSPRQTRDKNRSRFNAPKNQDWRDPDSPYFEKMNKVRETITTALRRQSYIKEF